MRWCISLAATYWVLSSASADEIYWTRHTADNQGGISRADTGTLVPETIIPSGLRSAYRIAVDVPSQTVFWSDTRAGQAGGLWRANLDGTGIERIYRPAAGTFGVTGVQVDPVAARVYWAHEARMFSANYDGSDRHLLLVGALQSIQDFVIEPESNRVYISDWAGHPDAEGRIRSARLDGSDQRLHISGLENGPVGITIDSETSHMYWSHYAFGDGVGGIQRAGLDGTSMETVLAGVDVDSLAFNAGDHKLYFAAVEDEGVGAEIRRMNLDGSDMETLALGDGPFGGVTVVPEPVPLIAILLFILTGVRRRARLFVANRHCNTQRS